MSNSNEKNGGIRFDDFVSKIVGDPAKPNGHTVLKGFVGRSSEEEHIRVYFDESLNYFIDVPEKAIIFTRQLSDSPLGGSTIWVKADTEYTYGNPAAEKRSKRKFFDGPVYRDYVNNLKTQEVDDSISFQYCMSTACTNNCSHNCITFQYCISRACTQEAVEQQAFARVNPGINNFNTGRGRFYPGQFNAGGPNVTQGADPNSISFQYCATQDGACPTQSSNCSDLCPSFQYCPSTNGACGQQFITDWYQRFNPANVLQNSNRNLNQQFNRFNAGGINQGADPNSISFQYCATQDSACPTQSANCSESCPSFQYCPSGSGSDCPSFTSNCGQQFITDWYQNPAFRNGGLINNPVRNGGFANNFNPYRAY